MSTAHPEYLLATEAIAHLKKWTTRSHFSFFSVSAIALLGAVAMMLPATGPVISSSAHAPLKLGKPIDAPSPAQVDMADQMYKEKMAAPVQELPAQF
ncbi:MAG: hypothetical protein ABIU58_01520 [Ramlibacter sp.]